MSYTTYTTIASNTLTHTINGIDIVRLKKKKQKIVMYSATSATNPIINLNICYLCCYVMYQLYYKDC